MLELGMLEQALTHLTTRYYTGLKFTEDPILTRCHDFVQINLKLSPAKKILSRDKKFYQYTNIYYNIDIIYYVNLPSL